ncbi:MAG: DUF3750 domain-containing protein [Planctomycetes bacterium]|nr:DUF3750 domain-containing protein [Planctomycetota bacterium]
MFVRPLCAIALLAPLAACRIVRPSTIPQEEPYVVVVASSRLPRTRPWISRFAHHTWFDVKQGDESTWHRVEVPGDGPGIDDRPVSAAQVRSDLRLGRETRVLALLTSDEAKSAAQEIRRLAAVYEDSDVYRPIPGPNSNTFVERIARRTPGLSVELHHNAVGKDYAQIVHVGISATKTGVELETPILGLQAGLKEGLELHFFQLTFGIGLVPPALKIPFVDRLGF